MRVPAVPVAGVAEEPEPADGRAARSARTRRAIVEALRSLHGGGDLRPTAPAIAERAGVSVRTVWQHFEDLESLAAEAGRVDLEVALSYLVPLDASLPLRERIEALVEQRARMFEAMAPVWRAARLQMPFSEALRHTRDVMFTYARSELSVLFAGELAADDDPSVLIDALLTASSWPAWESLRSDVMLDVDGAKRALSRWLHDLLR